MSDQKYYDAEGIARAMCRSRAWVRVRTPGADGIPVAATLNRRPKSGPAGRPAFLYDAQRVAEWARRQDVEFDFSRLPAPVETPYGVRLGDPVRRRPRAEEKKARKGGRLTAPVTRASRARDILDEDEEEEELDGAAPAPGRVTKSEAELRAMIARAELTEAKARLLSGEYVRREVLRKVLGLLGFNTRQRFSALPNRMSRKLATMDDQHEIHKYLTTEIDKILHSLAKTGLNLSDGPEVEEGTEDGAD